MNEQLFRFNFRKFGENPAGVSITLLDRKCPKCLFSFEQIEIEEKDFLNISKYFECSECGFKDAFSLLLLLEEILAMGKAVYNQGIEVIPK